MEPQNDPQWQNAVQARLERLFYYDGRDKPEHPQFGLYTGLKEKYDGLSRVSPRDS